MSTPIEKIFEDVQLHVNFTQAGSRSNIVTYDSTASEPENISTAFGKLSKWYEALVPTGGSSGKILGWNSSGTAKWINNTHSLSITAAASGDTSSISLSPNTKYKLTAGGSDFIFTSPNHVSVTKSADTTSTASPAHGGTFTTVDSVTRDANGHVTKINTKTVTLPADSNTDTLVSQTFATASYKRPLLMSYYKVGEAAGTAQVAYRNDSIYCNPSNGRIFATGLYTSGWDTSPAATSASLQANGLVLRAIKTYGDGHTLDYNRYVVRTYSGKSGLNTSDWSSNGMLVTVEGGGLTIVGGGESAASLAGLISDDYLPASGTPNSLDVNGDTTTGTGYYHTSLNGSSESLILSSDGGIYFATNCNTIAQRRGAYMSTDLSFYPMSTNTGSIGTSTYQWNTIYGKTIYENGTSLASKYAAIGHTHSYIPLSGSTSVTGKIGFSAINTGIWLKDASGTQVGALVDNGSNLWIGAGQSTLRHHKGETFISSGWSGTLPTTASSSLTGNETIKISVPKYTVDANGNGSWNHTGYPVLHSGNYTSYALASTTKYAGSSSAGGAATSANKLNTNAGATNRPVYFSGGIPVQCDAPGSGSWFKGVPLIGTDGVMEIGKYIDFHKSNDSTADYDLRLQYTGTATGKTITLPGATGTIALLTKGSTSYWGIIDGDGATSGWIRTTTNGFIPATSVSLANGGDGSLGTSSWAFKNAYIANINGVAVGSSPKFTDTTYSAGTGLSLSGTTINHSNSVTAKDNYNKKFFTHDAQGHITETSWYIHKASGTNGSNNDTTWIKIATLVHTSTYNNSPITITFTQRGNTTRNRLTIRFSSTNSNDPSLALFLLTCDALWASTASRALIVKTATSTWDVYIKKLDTHEVIHVSDFDIGSTGSTKLTWTWKDEQVATTPADATEATKKTYSTTDHTHSYIPMSGSMSVTGNIEITKASGDVGFYAKRSDTGVEVWMGVGSGGTNHGIYSNKLGKWMMYGDATNVYLNGNAVNVTGTVAIANGGTGATTRLNALKALTNENVSTNANYFLTITTSWGKGGYTSVADAKTVLGLKSAAYTESSAYATSGHTHTLSIAASSGTNALTLAASTKYELTAGGSSFIFTTPPNTTYSAGDHLSLSSTTFSIASYAKNLNGGDWNTATTNGWYMGSSCANAPSTAWWIGHVIAHNNKYCIQEIWQFTASTDGHKVPHKMRMFTNNVWGDWVDVTVGTQVPENALFTDANVTQTPAGSTYTNYRPLLIGNSSSATAGFTPTLTTGGTYAAAGIYCQPSSGKIYATELVTNTYPSGSGSALTHYGIYLKAFKTASLPAGGDYSYSRCAIKVYDGKAGDSSGMVLTVDSGGLTIVGGGESAVALANIISDDQRDANTSRTRLDVGGTLNTSFHGSSEQLILSSDNNIYFLTSCNTIANRKPVCLDTSSYFYPGTNKTGSIGTSSYMWNSVYAATIYENGTSLANKYAATGHTHNYAGSSSAGGAATNADVTVTDVPSTSTTTADSWYKSYGLIFAQNPNTTQANTLRKSHNLRFYHSPNGTADTVGVGELIVGNNTASGTAGNMQGRLILYSSSSSYHTIVGAATSTARTITIPAATGSIILGTKGSTSYYGLIDGGGSTSNWIRGTSNGFLPSASAKFFQTATSSLGTSTWYFKNSFIQDMTSNKLVLGAAKTADGAQKGQLKFYSGNGQDVTGTVTLECVDDATHPSDYTVKLPTCNGALPVFEKLFDNNNSNSASASVSLSFDDIDDYDMFFVVIVNSSSSTEPCVVASTWITNAAGVHDMPLIYGGAPTSSGGTCNVTSAWVQISKNAGTTTFVVAHKQNIAQMTSSGWTISSPTYNLYIRKIFGLKAYKRT